MMKCDLCTTEINDNNLGQATGDTIICGVCLIALTQLINDDPAWIKEQLNTRW